MSELGIPARGLAFIRHIETVETYGNSPIIVTPKTRDKIAAQQFVVVGVGDYERCDDVDAFGIPEGCGREHCAVLPSLDALHRHDVQEGDWVLVRNRSWDPTPDPSVYVCRVDNILGKFVET